MSVEPPARARAKVNLGLAVLGRRPDGYHDLASVFLRLDLADELSVSVAGGLPTADPDADRLVVDGPRPTLDPADDLVLRAAALLRGWAGRPLPALAFRLRKQVPLAAGLGGGSADAAAALVLAAQAWDLRLAPGEQLDLALRLGSDVPFFVADVPAAWVEGRGERVTPVAAPKGLGVLLVRPPLDLGTGAVFAAYDELAETGTPQGAVEDPGTAAPDAGAVQHAVPDPGAAAPAARPPARPSGAVAASAASAADAATFLSLAEAMRDGNDLWPAAARLCPELPALRAHLEARLGRPLLLTGSGPTLVALYPSPAAARAAVARVDVTTATVIATRPA